MFIAEVEEAYENEIGLLHNILLRICDMFINMTFSRINTTYC